MGAFLYQYYLKKGHQADFTAYIYTNVQNEC